MTSKTNCSIVAEKLNGLKIQIGFDSNARPNELFYQIPKHFSALEIQQLIYCNLIPENYNAEKFAE